MNDRTDEGFTLVEMLLSTVITGIIIGALATAVIIAINLYPASATRLARSNDVQRIALWFVPDVVSLGPQTGSVDTNPAATSSCKNVPLAENLPSASANVARLTWTDFGVPTARLWEASYRRLPGSPVMTRYFCQANSSGSSAIVGRNISSTSVTAWGTQLALTVVDLDSHGNPGPSFSVTANRRTAQSPVPPSIVSQPSATTLPLTKCTIKSASVSPPHGQLEADNSGHLQEDLTIDITTNGDCNGVVQVTFKPDNNGPAVTVPLQPAQYGATWAITVGSSQYVWTAGNHALTLERLVGQQNPETLQPLTKNPIPFLVTK